MLFSIIFPKLAGDVVIQPHPNVTSYLCRKATNLAFMRLEIIILKCIELKYVKRKNVQQKVFKTIKRDGYLQQLFYTKHQSSSKG